MESKAEVSASSSSSNGPKPALPKDAQVMVSLLKDMGVNDFDPRVVTQLLEFSYRYATDVLEDSKVLSAHAKKQAVDLDDVKLAVAMYSEQNMTSAPPRETLLDMARIKNNTPLPPPRKNSGMRLPPDRHCLTACNYRLKMKPKPGSRGGGPGMNRIGQGGIAFPSTTVRKMPSSSMGGMNPKIVAQMPPGTGMEPPQFMINNAVPKPIINMNTTGIPAPKINFAPAPQPTFKLTLGNPGEVNGGPNVATKKRKAEEMVAGYSAGGN